MEQEEKAKKRPSRLAALHAKASMLLDVELLAQADDRLDEAEEAEEGDEDEKKEVVETKKKEVAKKQPKKTPKHISQIWYLKKMGLPFGGDSAVLSARIRAYKKTLKKKKKKKKKGSKA